MKHIIRIFFRLIARGVLRRHRPVVVAVTGSVGKTATKEAITAALLSAERTIRKTEGNFNAEIGVPATVIAAGGPPSNVAGWISKVLNGLRALGTSQGYPKVLVLEMAADHPGDLQPLVDLVRPSIGVLTSAAPEHLEFFGDEANVVTEESLLVRSLSSSGTAVINIDDPRIAELVPKLKAKVITYGWSANAMVRAEGAAITKDDQVIPDGMVVKVSLDGSTIPIALPGVLGRHQAYPILAAIAVGRILGDELMSIIQRLSGYRPPAGRMRLFHGRDGSLIIDDTYNASPEAVQAALQALRDLDVPHQRIAVLGQMSELGSAGADWHDRIGREAAKFGFDTLVTVGPLADRIGRAAVAAGMPPARVQNVPNAVAAAAVVQPMLAPGVAVLLKGSRYASRLEQAVSVLLDNPDRDRAMLVSS